MEAKPGRVVGPVIPYENGRNSNAVYDGRMYIRSAVLPPQALSAQYLFRTAYTGKNQDKQGTETVEESTHSKLQQNHYLPAKLTHVTNSDINNHHRHQHHLYYQSQAKAVQLNSQIAIDAKLLQAQSQFGAVGAAAVAVAAAAHREVGAVQYGLT